MANEVEKVKSGYSELDYSQREEVRKFIKEYDDASFEKRKTFSESLKGVRNKSLGPTSNNTCPCCGR